VNWRQIYGDNAFILRPPVYWSEELAAKKAKQPDPSILEKQAKEYAKVQLMQNVHSCERAYTQNLRCSSPM